MKEANLQAILEAIGEKLRSLESEVYFKDLQIKELRAKLENAETEIRENEKNRE